MTTITITTERSEKWILDERLSISENVSTKIGTEINVSELSEKSRAALLVNSRGLYKDCDHLTYNKTYDLCAEGYDSYGAVYLAIDSHDPTITEIDEAIQAAMAKIAKIKTTHLVSDKMRKLDVEIRDLKSKVKSLTLQNNDLRALRRESITLATKIQKHCKQITS